MMKNLIMMNLDQVIFVLAVVWILDGAYYPRFIFVDKNGNIDYSITSQPEGSVYRYFYSKPDKFKENMNVLLSK